ncbi:MAG: hypothetical protein EDM74_11570 [Armatimonadetes bacterium]|nr:MAG: hypothetical protein EDM74_11570 [Armatimonadota bacterium]
MRSEQHPPKEVAFVKTALLMLDRSRLEAIDKELPHPLLLRDVLKDTGVQHATVFPLKHVRTSMGTNYQAVRHIVRDSMKVDQSGAFYDTLKWLAYRQWQAGSAANSPGFQCPHCREEITQGLAHNSDAGPCPHCNAEVFLSDVWGFHLDMEEDSAQESLAPFANIYYAGFLHDGEKEVVEAASVLSIARGSGFPTPSELGVMPMSFLNGMGEAASECRRFALDRMRAGDLVEASRILDAMEAVYEELITFDYSDAMTGGLRRTTDALRAVVERTRSDLTATTSQHELVEELKRTREALGK